MSAQKLRPSGVFGAIAGLVGFSAIAGVLVTAMVTPALAATSLTANSAIGIFQNLPDFIQLGTQAQQNTIYANRGGQPVEIATIYKQNRKEVAWGDVSQYLKDAAVDGEDRRFYSHGGVDIPSVVRALVKNNSEDPAVVSGSSTLDMQLVKNILIQQALQLPTVKQQKAAIAEASGASYDRKLKEMKLAIGLDKKYTKKQILLAYLNISPFGGNTYGVESGAEQYFSVSAKDLTIAQAASLMAIVQQPNLQNLSDPKYYPANKARRDSILKAMLEAKHITQKEYDTAFNTPIAAEVKISPPTSGCRNAKDAPFACDYVGKIITTDLGTIGKGLIANVTKNQTPEAAATSTAAINAEIQEDAAPPVTALGATPAERQANWDSGGYDIYTSIDLDIQDAAQSNLDLHTPGTETRFALGAASDTVEVGTGRILAMAQNKKFDDAPGGDSSTSAVNFSTDYPYGGSTGFPTGSTYKVFDLANWLQNGHGLNDLVDGTGPQTYSFSSFTAPCDPAVLDTGSATFPLQNDGNAHLGFMTVYSALTGSVNNAFMNMAERQDLCSIRDTAKSMGAHRADFKGDLTVQPSAILGTNEQAPLTMAAAAATIGANGLHCAPIIIDKIVGPNGKELPGQAKTCNQALTPEVAAGVANAMIGSETGGTSTLGNPRDGVQIAGKTGTSPSRGNDWAMATTTKIATAVWTGNITGDVSLLKYNNPTTHESYYSSSRFAIIKAVMTKANTILKGVNFPKASAAMLSGTSSKVPDIIGQTPEQAQALLTSLQFKYKDGGPIASSIPAGHVASTDPPANGSVPFGATITVYTSDGSLGTQVPANILGKSRHDALQLLTGAGFSQSNINIHWVASATPGDVCKVLASAPGAGQAASKSDPVTLNVSTGTSATTDPGPSFCPA